MFNLEQAIANWRFSLVQAGSSPEVIDELECHLRDEIESQMRTTSDPQLAFDNAVLLMGDPVQLEEQFKEASIADEKTRGSFIPFSSLVKVAAVLTVPFAIILLLSSFRVFDLQRNIVGILVGWLIFTVGTISTLVIIFRVAKLPVPCRAVVAIDPFPASRLQSPLLLEQARSEALALGHDFIGTEHLLLALLNHERGENRPLNLNYQSIRSEVTRLVSPNAALPTSSRLSLTPRANKALQIAEKEAKRLNQPLVSIDHILSGLILEGSGVAAEVLKRFRSR